MTIKLTQSQRDLLQGLENSGKYQSGYDLLAKLATGAEAKAFGLQTAISQPISTNPNENNIYSAHVRVGLEKKHGVNNAKFDLARKKFVEGVVLKTLENNGTINANEINALAFSEVHKTIGIKLSDLASVYALPLANNGFSMSQNLAEIAN